MKIVLKEKLIEAVSCNNIDDFNRYIIYLRTDIKGIITEVSEPFCTISKYDKQELLGTRYILFENIDIIQKLESLNQDESYNSEVKYINKDKKIYWCDTVVAKTLNKKGDSKGYIVILTDITNKIALRELNNNLEEIVIEEISKNRQKEILLFSQSKLAQLGEMISMIAHQWRQPLAAISSSVIDMQMKLMLKKQTSDELLKYVENELYDIESYTQTLTVTIDDFRDFYKLNKNPVEVKISKIINGAYSIMQTGLSSLGIDVIFSFDVDESISVYENEIVQVLINLFQNAKDNFILRDIQNKKIIISTKELGDTIEICFQDNGGGIAQENLDKIFEPYFSTKQNINGTGLGLYMCYKIIKEHHNGQIRVENKDEGALFIITLNKKNDFENFII